MRKTAKQTVRRSDAAAKDFVTELGGRKTRASGSGLEKGDGRVPGRFRTETKRPPTGKYRITMPEWSKVHSAAISGGEVALMHLVLDDVELIALRLQDFIGLGGKCPWDEHDLGMQKGHTLSKKVWLKALLSGPSIRFSLLEGDVERHFIAVDRTDFIKLVGTT